MLVEKKNDFRDQKGVEATTGSDRCVYILNVNELNQAEEGLFQWDSSIVEQCLCNKSFTFDHQAQVDYIGLLFLDPDNRTEPGGKNLCCRRSKQYGVYPRKHATSVKHY
ncbi:MAG: hypothetical protein ACOX1U_05740 [Saccharofermentanales bacterium]